MDSVTPNAKIGFQTAPFSLSILLKLPSNGSKWDGDLLPAGTHARYKHSCFWQETNFFRLNIY